MPRIDLEETHEEEMRKVGEWHIWFAWYPVRDEGGNWLPVFSPCLRCGFIKSNFHGDTTITYQYRKIK